jgi:bacillithiol synthase
MPTDCISLQASGCFSEIIVDYLNQIDRVKPLYNFFPTIENFKKQLELKQHHYNKHTRGILVKAIKKQYQNTKNLTWTSPQIQLISESNTFTITTGHQLNLFTGPMYFLYKIISTINLCKQLKTSYPSYNFIPIYWMATEDHDFEEINHFQFKDKKIQWSRESSGPVGRLDTEGLAKVLEAFKGSLGPGIHAKTLVKLFEDAYINHHTLSQATRHLAHTLFAQDGLLIVDGDDLSLKKMMVPYFERELISQTTYSNVSQTISNWEDYKIQVNPREINLFYITDKIRERIVFENNQYKILNTTLRFSKENLLKELHTHPERFSPNVLLRPLYQEVILPNLCYIGGGGELAYWLELHSTFNAFEVPFPILLLRNSVLISSKKIAKKADKLSLTWQDLFLSESALINKKTKNISNHTIDFSSQKAHLKAQFENLYQIASQTDASFLGAVAAQEKKQLKGLELLEKRLLKAEKKAHQEQLERIIALKKELFPGDSLQERKANFSNFYINYGPALFEHLKMNLKPLSQDFVILVLE